MKLTSYIIYYILICPFFLNAQLPDSIPLNEDSRPIQDSLTILREMDFDSIAFESPPPQPKNNKIKISEDALDTEVDWGAKDTMWFDKKHNRVHLVGGAFVQYESLNLKAGYIIFDFDINEATAQPLIDSLGNETELPVFEDGNQTFNSRKLRYNFKSRKGMVYDAIKKEGEFFVHGAVTKYISKEADTINNVETIFAKDGIITSCDAEHPHFGIRASKLKIVPNKLAVLGFSMLEIAHIPTPLVLPFGFYPMFQNQRSGIILPKNYSFNQRLGYGFTGIGVYFPMNEYYDIKLTGDIYTRGSWGLQWASNYKKRYKYNGNFQLSYFNTRTEVSGSLQKNSAHAFSLRLSHNQDTKAHPYQKFGGSISLTLNGYDKAFNTDAATVLNNTTRSNLRYDNKLPNSIFSFNAGLEHSQNTNTGEIDITFPVARLNMKAYYPFKSKKSAGKPKWYEQVSINYNADAKNLIETTDSTFFDASTFQNARYGLKHSASSSTSFTVLKYLKVNPSINYSETYFTKMKDINFLEELQIDSVGVDYDGNIEYDTLYGRTIIDTINTFKPFRDFNSSVSVSTKQYGKILFSKGWLRGLRHQVSYNVGFRYKPNTKQFYEVELDQDYRDAYEDYETYNIFVRGPYGLSNPNIRQMALTYNIGNIVEAKYFSKADSIAKKVNLLKNFNITGNYNFAADSLKFSAISLSASTTLFNNLLRLRYSGVLDPYMENNGRRINTFVWDEKKRPFRHERSKLDLATGFSIRQLVELISGSVKNDPKDQKDNKTKKGSPDLQQESSLLDILGAFKIKYDLSMTWEQVDGRDTFYIARNVISTQGSIKLTENWNIRIGHVGYDFKGKSITYPDLGFERNLHCWTMNFSWRPKAGQYTFFIGVRSQTLNFLKYQHGQSPLDVRTRSPF